MNRIFTYCTACFLLFASGVWAQSSGLAISGKVTDKASGETLPGVSIKLKNTSVGTVTDLNGRFTLKGVKQGDLLVFTYLGYKPAEVQVAEQKEINVNLETSENSLNEVVVVGYGEQSRATITTSISKVSEKEFEHAPGANPLLQLQGKVAGLSLQISDGQPGSTPQVFIRGGSSTSPESDAPLFIVDGVIGVMRNISELNTDDIESVQVLKDAASTAIYGARASNGVIIIQTKKGKIGKPVVNFKYTSGIEQQAKRYNFATARDYVYISRLNTVEYNKTNPDFFLSGGHYGMSTGNPRNSRNTLEFLDTYLQNYGQDYVADLLNNQGWETMADPATGKTLLFKGTNYQDVTFQTGNKREYDFNISGGNDKATYYLGLGHLDQDGIVLGTYYKNYNALFKGTFKLSDAWSFDANLSYEVKNNNSPNSYTNTLSRSTYMPFTYRLTYEDGLPAPGEGIASFRNRNYEVFYKEKYNDVNVYRTTLGLNGHWNILPGLRFEPSVSYYAGEGLENYFEAANETNMLRTASSNHNLDKRLQLDGLFTYSKTFGIHHNFNAVLGSSYIKDYSFAMSGSGNSAPTDYIPTLNATVATSQRVSTIITNDALASYFSRVNYDFDRKYLFSASLRYDGSARFAENHKWGFFPGVSAGWNVDQEKFWQPVQSYISHLKLRTSYGLTGNNNLSIANSQGAYGTGYNYQGQVGILNTTLANNDLIWETTSSYDGGIDMGFFKDRLTLLVDYYSKTTSDRLFAKPLDATTGFSSITSNYGSIRNSGFEVELGATPVKLKNFSWNLSATFAYNMAIVVKLPDNGRAKNRIGGNTVYDPKQQKYVDVGGFAEGEQFGGRWAYKMLGVYATDADAAKAPKDMEASGRTKVGGDAIWADLDNNGIIDNRDMVFVGYIRPDKTGGLVNTFQYKALSLRVAMDYAFGNVIDDGYRGKLDGSQRNNNMILTDVLGNDIWKQQGDQGKTIPRYTVQSDFDYNFKNFIRSSNGLGGSGTNIDRWYSKGNYVAFREISLSYQLKTAFLKKAHIQGIEIFGGVYNVGYATSYDGLMPEIDTGVDVGGYPRPREYNFGMRATF